MKRTALKLVTLAIAAVLPMSAQATVEGFILYNVPYKSVQTDDICWMRLPMLAQFGIPQAAIIQASLAPTSILKDFPTRRYININLASPTRPLVHTYILDNITATNVWEYTMKLDVTALAAANGFALGGRVATLRTAKLALLAIARNMDDLSDGNFRLRVTFTGLPSQVGVAGTRLNATTGFPYTSTSALLIAYDRELIDVEGGCQTNLE